MKRVMLEEVRRLTGEPYLLLKTDSKGDLVRKTDSAGKEMEEYETHESTSLVEILEQFVLRNIPGVARDKYTHLDALRAANIYRSLKAANNGVLELDEPEHDWLKAKLKDDAVGVRVFFHNVLPIEDALDNFERKHEPKRKGSDSKEAEPA